MIILVRCMVPYVLYNTSTYSILFNSYDYLIDCSSDTLTKEIKLQTYGRIVKSGDSRMLWSDSLCMWCLN